DVALLLRGDRAEAHRPQRSDGLDAVVAARNPRGDEARRRQRERDVADFHALEYLVRLPLVVRRDVVGRIELALRVVVDVEVHALGDGAGGAHGELEAELRLEHAAAVLDWTQEVGRDAALVAVACELRLDPGVE